MQSISTTQRRLFQETIWQYYHEHGRHDLPWRQAEVGRSLDPYKVLVSEMMLQQTQVSRVLPKYHEFLAAFPRVQDLAAAELGAVLRIWQGLGYNRRAKFLWQAAGQIESRGAFPEAPERLTALPGIGANTAGAILAYAYNRPVVFVETNIRSVYIHHFTRDGEIVSDDFIRDVLRRTVDTEQPREFYWALMDYGSYLKTHVRNTAQSKHYTKQTPFHGSSRQIRGQVLRALAQQPRTHNALAALLPDERLPEVLRSLQAEGLIQKTSNQYRL